MQYRPEIDGLRAVAVVPVVLFHAGVPGLSGGYVGVDIFFVISGFLITTILINELREDRLSIVNFYERRARRILPALFFVIAVSLPVAWLLLVPLDLIDFGQSLVAVALFSSNILFWLESGYFDVTAELKPMLHTWSLAVEEQYYILFPLLLMVFWRWGRRALLPCLIAIFLASLALAQWMVGPYPDAAFYLLPSRAWELMVGSFVAFYLIRPKTAPLPPALAQAGSLSGLALIAWSILVFDATTPFPSLYTLLPVVGAALIILCATKGTLAHRLLSSPGCVGIGLISYSTYLWHQPLFAFARYSSLDHPPMALMLGLALLSLALAYLSWAWIEQPFRAKGRVSRNAIFGLSGAGMAGVIAVGAMMHLTEGQPARFSPEKQAMFASVQSSPRRNACHNVLVAGDACTYFSETATWAVLGDSHAAELSYALATRLRPQDDGVVQFSRAACPPRWRGPTDAYCTDWTHEAMDAILANPDITTVVLSYRIASHLFGDHKDIYPAQPDSKTEADRDQIWQSYLGMMDALIAAGKTVHVVIQAPEAPAHINQMLRAAGANAQGYALPGVPRAWWDNRIGYVTARRDQIPDSVHVHDPADSFCDATQCYMLHQGQALYFDNNHMSLSGAGVLADEIVQTP